MNSALSSFRASLSQRQAWMDWAGRVSFSRVLATSRKLSLGGQMTLENSGFSQICLMPISIHNSLCNLSKSLHLFKPQFLCKMGL